MDRIDELIDLLREVSGKKKKDCNIVAIILTVVLVIAVVCGAVYAIYRFVTPKYMDDEDFDFDDDDDFDDFFEDEEDDDEVTVSPLSTETEDAE